MGKNLDLIKRINKTIVHPEGTYDSFEKQLLNLSGGIFDVTKPLIVSGNSRCLGFIDSPKDKLITMRVGTALKIREKHEIGYAFVGQCLDMLKGSVLAFDSLSQDNSKVILLDAFNDEGEPYIAICRTNKLMNGLEVNEITSIYTKENIEKFLVRTFEADKKFYKNKKTERYIRSQRLQLPREMIYALSENYSNRTFSKSQVKLDFLTAEFDSSSKTDSLDRRIASAGSRRRSSVSKQQPIHRKCAKHER